MAGFFYNLGRLVGPKVRKAEWVLRSLTGSEAEAIVAEQAVGRDLARAFVEQLGHDPDPVVREHLDYLAAKLTAAQSDRRWGFRFLAVRAPEVNAFALPGGFVFVTRHLLEVCGWDHAELAFVLGHEMGHIVKRHAIERLMANTLFSGVVARLPVGGAVLRPHVAALLNTLLRQGYSREQELEADAFGARAARAAGFDPAGARRVLVRLAAESAAEPLLSGYFASHPPLDVRLRHLEPLTGH
ncbi:MAG TPA: M48 family metalloprotease [Gemmataceae bacterium]|nr:M48 family metalloprotease [Gemmataceae bacterium]